MKTWTSTAGSKQQIGTLTWNANGTLQSLQINDTANSANTQTCTNLYDDLGRLSSNSCAGGWGQNFSYDPFGNITKTVISGHSGLAFQPTYVVPTNNRIASVPGATIAYDGMGNMKQDNLGNSYSYDAEGRPITAAGVQTTFDAFGRALEQNRSGSYAQIVYAPSGQKFAFMNGQTLIKYIAPMVAGMAAVHTGPNGNPPNSGYFQHADWLGSSRWAHDGSGNVIYDRAYAPFGEPYAETATTNRDFTGQTEDTTLGLYDFPFRQQSQSQGRWLTPDPAGLAAVDITNPQTWNRYAYLSNNPLNATDPLGLYCAVRDPDTGTPMPGCNTTGDPYFGGWGDWGWGGIGAGGVGGTGSGFSITGISNPFCGSDFLPCGLPTPSPWPGLLGLPSDLNCPAGLSFLCGGIDPALDESPLPGSLPEIEYQPTFLERFGSCFQQNMSDPLLATLMVSTVPLPKSVLGVYTATGASPVTNPIGYADHALAIPSLGKWAKPIFGTRRLGGALGRLATLATELVFIKDASKTLYCAAGF